MHNAKWNGSNETYDGYKAWVNDVSLWANQNQMVWIMKITKRLQEAPNFEFRLFNSGSIFNMTLREELFSLPKQSHS